VPDLIPYGSHAAATSLVHRNSVPSTQMRCMITANRRARATIMGLTLTMTRAFGILA
jgi:hypothetical protein